jgi:AraC-like DNA-binding protein
MSDIATLLDAALRGTALAVLLLLAATLWRDHASRLLARVAIVFCAGLCVQVIGSTPLLEATLPPVWQAPLVAVAVGNAVLFWVFVQALFDDEFALRPVHVLCWLGVALLSAFNCAVMAGSGSPLAGLTWGLQRAAPALFAALAAWAALAGWRSDLVEGRRRLRGFIVVAGVAYTLAQMAARLAAPRGLLVGWVATADVAALLFMLGVTALALLRLPAADFFAARSVPSAAPSPSSTPADESTAEQAPDPAEERLAATLQRVMNEERAYRSEGLSVASLAARLNVPEYRLRRLINQRLGHRNFNAFVNAFRLDETRAALADPQQAQLPVLTIALTAGFGSIGPFNRAFKAATGLTPTEFRKQCEPGRAEAAGADGA